MSPRHSRSHLTTAFGIRRGLLLLVAVLSQGAVNAQGLGGIDLGGLTDHVLFVADGSQDANWQGASKGFVGNVAIDGFQAGERTSGSFAFAGTISTNDSTLGAWQGIVDHNPGQASAALNDATRIQELEATLNAAFLQINALTSTSSTSSPAASVSAGGLDGLDTRDGVGGVFVIDVTGGFGISGQIEITGDADDYFILRWDTDAATPGYQGQVKFQSGGAIVPLGDLTPANFIHVAGDINSSGGGSAPAAPYPQGPRLANGTGALISGASDFGGGGFFTGYWLTTGSPENPADATHSVPYGKSSSMSNGIFVGGWYTICDKFSLTSGTSAVYVAPPEGPGTLGDFVWLDADCDGCQDSGEHGIAGLVVNLVGEDGFTVLASTVTDAQGAYSFSVAPGQYSIEILAPGSILTPSPMGQGGDFEKDSDLDPATGVIGPILVVPGIQRPDLDAGFCSSCVGTSVASVQSLDPICDNPLDPVLASSPPWLGTPWTVSIDSVFPNAVTTFYLSIGPPNPTQVPGTDCFVYPNISTAIVLYNGFTDSEGDASVTIALPPLAWLSGVPLTIQARVCEPSIPGPIPGLPDWITNGLLVTLGCP
ncbi:MAG: SdrD B-like domain-containing protein [Planctomycetota bacterium]